MLPSQHRLGLSEESPGYSIREREEESSFKPGMQSWEMYASEHPRCSRRKTREMARHWQQIRTTFFWDESHIAASQEPISFMSPFSFAPRSGFKTLSVCAIALPTRSVTMLSNCYCVLQAGASLHALPGV